MRGILFFISPKNPRNGRKNTCFIVSMTRDIMTQKSVPFETHFKILDFVIRKLHIFYRIVRVFFNNNLNDVFLTFYFFYFIHKPFPFTYFINKVIILSV